MSREPLLQSVFIHRKPRVVIQDFFLATLAAGRHRAGVREENRGAFSYHIEEHLQLFYVMHELQVRVQRASSCALAAFSRLASNASSSGADAAKERKSLYILEMKAEVINPLIDASNHRLSEGCLAAQGLRDSLRDGHRKATGLQEEYSGASDSDCDSDIVEEQTGGELSVRLAGHHAGAHVDPHLSWCACLSATILLLNLCLCLLRRRLQLPAELA